MLVSARAHGRSIAFATDNYPAECADGGNKINFAFLKSVSGLGSSLGSLGTICDRWQSLLGGKLVVLYMSLEVSDVLLSS